MEKKKCNVAKIIFRVLGILFSIVLIPALTVWVPAGGAIIGASNSVSRENLKEIVAEAGLSEYVIDIVENEIADGITSDQIQAKYLQDAVLGSITTEWVDSVILDVFDAAYDGVRPQITVSPVTKNLQATVDELSENCFEDLYAVWWEGAQSQYFTDEFVDYALKMINEKILEKYPEYNENALKESEERYDALYGEGKFSELLDNSVSSFEGEWSEIFSEEVEKGISDISKEVEEEVNDAVYDAIQTPELRDAVDILQQLENKAKTLKWIVYGAAVGAILLLVSCFWFDVCGFVVSAVPMFLGGVLCKIAVALGSRVYEFLEDMLTGEPALEDFTPVINGMSRKLIDPLFGEISKAGNIALITGVVLVGLAILRGVIKKNMATEE